MSCLGGTISSSIPRDVCFLFEFDIHREQKQTVYIAVAIVVIVQLIFV